MPLTGRFAIDFADLYVGVQRAELSLKSFTAEGAKVEKQLNRVADSLSGHKLIQDATLMAGAVEKLGGVSRLTADEQARVNKVVQDAIDKYKALGETAPHSLTSLAEATRKVEEATRPVPKGIDSIGSSLLKVAGAVGIGFSVGAVVNFGRHVFDAASQIHDMASALGVSVEAAQRYKFAAEQSGATMEDVSRAINNMNKSLAEPGKGTVDALRAAGLSLDEIRSMRPEEAFNAITEAVKQIPDPVLQAKVAAELFGKSSLALLPGIKEGFAAIGKSATVMSTDTINSLESAQDAWGRLADKVTVLSGTLIAAATNTASSVTSSWKNFVLFADTAIKQGIGAAVALTNAEVEAAKAASKHHDINLTLPPVIKSYAEQLRAAQAELSRLTSAQLAEIKTAEQIGISQQEIASKFNLSDAAMHLLNDRFREHPKVVREAAKASADMIPTLSILTGVYGQFGERVQLDIPIIKDWTIAVRDGIESAVGLKEELTIPAAHKGLFASLFGDPKDFGQQIATAIQGAIQGGGNVAGAAAGAVGVRIGTNISDSLTKEGGALFNKALGSIFAGALPVIGSLLGPLTSAIWNKLFGSAGRDAVKTFASSFGGFDALHEQLNALGAAGEQLWIKLTQGVGKNNPEQAKAVIDEITKALDAQKAKASEAGDAAAAQAGTVTEANQKALDAIKAMNDEMQGLFDSIKDEAPEEVMGVVERQTRDKIAAIQKERDAAQQAMTETTSHAAEAAKEAGEQIDAALKARQFVIRVRAEIEGLDGLGATGGIRGGPTPQIFHEAAGGDFLVTRPTLFLAGEAGPERATFSGGGRTGASTDGQPLHNVIQIDGLTLIEAWTRAKKRYVG